MASLGGNYAGLRGNFGGPILTQQAPQNYIDAQTIIWGSTANVTGIQTYTIQQREAPTFATKEPDPGFIPEGGMLREGVHPLTHRGATNDWVGADGSVWEQDYQRCGYRRVTSLAWLDRRVNEMRVKL